MQQTNFRSGSSQLEDATGGMAFGSVLSSITRNNEITAAVADEKGSAQGTESAILALFNMATNEDLITGLEQNEIFISKWDSLQVGNDLTQFLAADLSEIYESIMPLLEQTGLSESELLAASTTNDLWSFLNLVDEVAPKFFSELLSALEGKGVIPKEHAIELLVYLKTVAIKVPDTDLTMKQEQLLFSLQGFLVATGERFESTYER